MIVIAMTACNSSPNKAATETATLYRNSFADRSLRVHWATFDAVDRYGYNINNCLMAAGILNANMNEAARSDGQERDTSIGFWCEPGAFSEDGTVPTSFLAQFPAGV